MWRSDRRASAGLRGLGTESDFNGGLQMVAGGGTLGLLWGQLMSAPAPGDTRPQAGLYFACPDAP